jgi:hypothetical protein
MLSSYVPCILVNPKSVYWWLIINYTFIGLLCPFNRKQAQYAIICTRTVPYSSHRVQSPHLFTISPHTWNLSPPPRTALRHPTGQQPTSSLSDWLQSFIRTQLWLADEHVLVWVPPDAGYSSWFTVRWWGESREILLGETAFGYRTQRDPRSRAKRTVK